MYTGEIGRADYQPVTVLSSYDYLVCGKRSDLWVSLRSVGPYDSNATTSHKSHGKLHQQRQRPSQQSCWFLLRSIIVVVVHRRSEQEYSSVGSTSVQSPWWRWRNTPSRTRTSRTWNTPSPLAGQVLCRTGTTGRSRRSYRIGTYLALTLLPQQHPNDQPHDRRNGPYQGEWCQGSSSSSPYGGRWR